MCLWLVKHEGFLRPQHLGEAGTEQGRDIVAYKPTLAGEQLWYFQCKRYSKVNATILIAEVEKYNSLVARDPDKKPTGIVFITNAVVSAYVREKVEKYCLQQEYECEFWARTELDMLVNKYPVIVEQFFYATNSLHIPALHTFDQITPKFLEAYRHDDSDSFFYSGTVPTWSDIVHQRDIPRDISNEILFTIETWQKGRLLVPILAEAGEGKSTFLRHLAVKLCAHGKTVLYLKRGKQLVDVSEIQYVARQFNGTVYVFIDDAARVQNFRGFIEAFAELSFPLVLIVASRPYEWKPFRSVYSANVQLLLANDKQEHSLTGASDNEIKLLFKRLAEAGRINTLPDAELDTAVHIYKESSKGKLLILVLELTKGQRAKDIIRAEIERVREMGKKLYTAYRYICLMGSVHSYMTTTILNKLIKAENISLDVVVRLPGLVEAIAENLYVRHDRIGEIATEIMFEGADEQRGNLLCKIASLAFEERRFDVIHSMIGGVHRSLPQAQLSKVCGHIADEAYCVGQFDLIKDALGDFYADASIDEVLWDLLAVRTPLIWKHIIFANQDLVDLNWDELQRLYSERFVWTNCRESFRERLTEPTSFESASQWADIFSHIAQFSGWGSKYEAFFTSITEDLYKALAIIYPERKVETHFRHAEFLRFKWRENEAVELYKRVIKYDSLHAEAHSGLALCLYFMSRYHKAFYHYKMARELNWKSLFSAGHEDVFEEMLRRLGDWEEVIKLRKHTARNSFEMKRGIQASEIGRRMLIELKISKNAKDHEKDLLKVFGSKASEKDLIESLAVMDRILSYVRTLPSDKQTEFGKRIFGASFGELRRKRRMN